MYSDAEELFFQADKLVSEDNIVEAKDMLFEILENHPDHGKTHNHLGWIFHYKMIDYKKAREHYKYSIKYSSNYYAAYVNYAYLLVDLGDCNEMLKFGQEALKVQGVDKGSILNQMAKSQELLGHLSVAYELYKKAKSKSLAHNYIEEINASLQRVRDKMNIFQKIVLLFK